MANARTPATPATPEVRFWACIAVIFALFAQVLFPAQVMAEQTGHGTRFVLCNDTFDAAPVADTVSAKLFSHKTKTYQGLKCANCVLASITAVTPPAPHILPVLYSFTRVAFTPSPGASTIRARAPPRPHSCGPPSDIQAA